MICPNCDRRIDDDALVCEYCGKELPEPEEEEILEPEEEMTAPEGKPLMGFLGAAIGAILGCLVVILLPMMGLAPSFGGVVIAPFIFIGYSILCKGKTKSGLGVCIMFAIFTPYMADRANWAIWMMNNIPELQGIGFVDAFLGMPLMLDAGKIELNPYYLELFKLYIFAAVGAVAYVAGVMRARKKKKMQEMLKR